MQKALESHLTCHPVPASGPLTGSTLILMGGLRHVPGSSVLDPLLSHTLSLVVSSKLWFQHLCAVATHEDHSDSLEGTSRVS